MEERKVPGTQVKQVKRNNVAARIENNKFFYLIVGYIRKSIEVPFNMIIPHEIQLLCFKYRGTHFMDETVILSLEEQTIFLDMIAKQILDDQICEYSLELKLLFRMSRDGKRATDFHKLCDNKGATITIFQTKEWNHVFGGYAKEPWQCKIDNKYCEDSEAFLFLLRSSFGDSPQIYTVVNPGYAEYHYSGFGPSFGILCSVGASLDKVKDLYTVPESTYKFTGNMIGGGAKFDKAKIQQNYLLNEYEVFQVALV